MDNIHSINFSSNNTVDRKKETKFLLSNIEQKNIDVIIIYSETGIGKSTLLQILLERYAYSEISGTSILI